MDKMDKESEAYKCGEYDEFFEAADSHNLVSDEATIYATSLYHLEDVESSVSFASMIAHEKGREEGLEKGREEGLEKGREEGLEKGREEGRMDEKRNMAAALLEINLPLAQIMSVTGLSKEEIIKIKNKRNDA